MRIRALSAGRCHVCAIDFDEQVWCWGCGVDREGRTAITDRPRKMDGIAGATELEAMKSGACALSSDGQVRCWGADQSVRGGPGKARRLVHGSPEDCALRGGGELWCSGSNRRGRLGMSADPENCPKRAESVAGVVPMPGPVTDAFVGEESGCALLQQGNVFCWGNAYGCSGPVPVALPESIVQLDGGGGMLCLQGESGAIYTLEEVTTHTIGEAHGCYQNDPSYYRERQPVITESEAFSCYADSGSNCGLCNGCAVHSDGKTSCWGLAADPGTGRVPHRGAAAPMPMSLLPPVRAVGVGSDFACAITRADRLLCWGWNRYGALGRGFCSDLWEKEPAEPLWPSAGSE